MKAEGRRQQAAGGKAPRLSSAAEVRRVREMLAGGDRRSIGRANEVAALALAGTLDFGAVCAAMFDEDPVVRMRAADTVEKVSAERPAWPRPFKAEFLAGLPDFRLPEMRWHAAQILPRLDLTAGERDTLALPVLLEYLRDQSRIVQTCALQALADFAFADAALRPRVIDLLETALRTGPPAVQARSRRLLAHLRKPAR